MNTRAQALMTLEEALQRVLDAAAPLGRSEWVALWQADGRVLAQDIVSELQVPPNDNSAMDGYAVRAAEVVVGQAVTVSQRIAAGHAASPLLPGTCARIFTGAPMPAGADAVVMQEDVEVLDGQVRWLKPVNPGAHVRRAGEDVARGAVVLRAGDRLTPAGVGLAASLGVAQLCVAVRPRVALLTTGDELVMPGTIAPRDMAPGHIYNSNRFVLSSLLQRLGCEVSDLGNVPDSREATVAALRDAAQHHDLILSSGGVSVGEEDHVKPAVQALGSLDLWQVAMKPGKPFALGRVHAREGASACHFIGLPGNPVSSWATLLLLVRPFVRRLQGANSGLGLPTPLALPAHFDWPRADKRREFLRVRRNAQGGLDVFPNQSSGVLTSAFWADGLVDNPAGATIVHGQSVHYLPLADWGV
jgi:molybdopterin molybdotransferase